MTEAAIQQFGDAIRAAGLPDPEVIYDDGKLHRFSTNGRRGDGAGWYVLHTDGIPAGAFGCWRQGVQCTWSAVDDRELTPAEREAHRRRLDAIQAERMAEEARTEEAAAQQAQRRFAAAQPANGHPYLVAKGIQPHGARIERDGTLLVPMRDAAGKLWNVERIGRENFGTKRGLTGGRRKGLYCAIGRPADVLVICEGFATGASIHEATGHPVAVAFNAGNLGPVALALREKYPHMALMLAADDDWKVDGNPGMTKATAAAAAVGGLVAVPRFTGERPDKATDFNDLHQLHGADAVRECFDSPTTAQAADNWPIPQRLPDALPAVEPFAPELLPDALREWVIDIAHRMQCPADFPAVGAIVATSSLIGARAVIHPKERDDWQVVPNLWGVCIARPGAKKSPALAEALKPLHRLQAREQELWQAVHDAWLLDAKVCDLAQADREKKAKGLAAKDAAAARALLQTQSEAEPEPVARRFIVNDATMEKLGELLKDNPWGTLAYRDELHGLLTSLDKQGQEGARGFYLEAYTGDGSYTFDRIGRGTVHIPRVCLALIGSIQPSRIQEYVRSAVSGGRGDDGLLQRFGLAVWPDMPREILYVDQWPDTSAKQRAWAVFERLAGLEPGVDGEPVAWRFRPEAQAAFAEWLTELENDLQSPDLHPALCSHLAKYRKLIPALSLIFALVDTPEAQAVGLPELERALAWGDYLRSHAVRLYSAAVQPETEGARTLLTRIKGGKLTDSNGLVLESFTARQVAQKCWAGLGTPESVRKAADVLAEWDYLRCEAIPGGAAGGRPSERYRINPGVFREAAR